MKAKEYYEIYRKQLLDTNSEVVVEASKNLMLNLNREFQTMCDQRKARSGPAVCGIVRELNDKYNAISALFEAKDGRSPLKKDGFRRFWEKSMPSLQGKVAVTEARRTLSWAQICDGLSYGQMYALLKA